MRPRIAGLPVALRIGDKRHRVVLPAVIAVCTGPEHEKKNGRCPFPDRATAD